MFGYGSKLAAARTLDEIFNNLYVLVIGRIFAPVQVGYYQRAKSFQLLPARNIYGVVEKVMFPLMSAVQSERERMNRAFDGALRAIVIVTFPIFVGMAVVAEPMILTLIGEKWRPAVPFLQVLCIVGALWPVQSLNLSVLRATGHSGKVLWLGIVKKALVAIAILLTWRHGIAAMIWGQVAVSLVALVLNTHYNRRLIGFPLFRQMRVALPYALAAAAMGAAVWALVQWVPALPVVLFGAGVLLGALVYTALLKAMQLPENRQFTAMVGKYPVIGPLARFVFGQNP